MERLTDWQNRVMPTVPSDDGASLLQKAAAVRPDARQVEWQKLGLTLFVHFGMNTFTDREWGLGNEDPSLFNPTALDCEQWARAAAAMGAGEIILTCKHHDGFCLWPSAYTEHSVKHSPFRGGKGDVVRECAEACRKYGLKFGVYLSPWDRHEKTYGTGASNNAYYLNQLTELLSNYGPICELWLDGACGEGENGKKQEYDWVSFWTRARELQPDIVISDVGPDVRWVGNEAGDCRTEEWSPVFVPQVSGRDADETLALSFVHHNLKGACCAKELATEEALAGFAGKEGFLAWLPAQVDTSIRPGWFYHASEDDQVRSCGNLTELYLRSVGGNATLLLNIPPDRRGLFHENDVESMRLFGEWKRRTLDATVSADASLSADTTSEGSAQSLLTGNGLWVAEGETAELTLTLPHRREVHYVTLCEPTEKGQSVCAYELDVHIPNDGWQGKNPEGVWTTVAQGRTIGSRKIETLPRVFCDAVRLRILRARSKAMLSAFTLHND